MEYQNQGSEYVIRLGLSQAIEQYMTIGSNFLSKRIFVLEYFGAGCCRKILEPDWIRNQ